MVLQITHTLQYFFVCMPEGTIGNRKIWYKIVNRSNE